MPGDEAGLGAKAKGPGRGRPGDPDFGASYWPAVNRIWEETESIFPGGKLPLSVRQVLKAGFAYGWGFGPITLVMRMNHPEDGVDPFYLSWAFDPRTGKWKPEGGRTRSGEPLNVKGVLAMLPEVMVDPDCRDGKHDACIGEPCTCECHFEEAIA